MQGALRILLRSSEAISTANTETERLGESCKQKMFYEIFSSALQASSVDDVLRDFF